MRRLPLLLASLPLVLASPASAHPLVATFAGIGHELCPASPGFPCSYEGHSLVCEGATIIDLRTPYNVACEAHLLASTSPCAAAVTSGTFSYRDDLQTAYDVRVTVRDNTFSGSITTEEGPVTVTGTLHPFAGTLTRTDSAAPASAAKSSPCPDPV